jgi:pimeloyl-ACP methyl ester carboxylesterase
MPIFTTSDGAEINYRAAGDPTNGFALFVHPFMHDGTIFLDQLKGLRDIRQCIAIDMRGHGKSDPNPNPSIVDTEHVADLVEFIDSLPAGKIDLVGMAYGGNMCALAYEQRPERMRSLTMISSGFGAIGDPAAAAAGKRYTAELGRLAVVEDKGVVFRRWLEYIVAPNASLFAKARYRSVIERTPTETMVAFLANGKITPRPDLPAKLKLPVFVPVGKEDGIVTLEGPLSEIEDFHTVTIESAGRLLPIEAPEELNGHIRDFWAKVG